ncbi:MAG: nucleotide pyrophosphatase/phosphodiesterase family protein, partial [Pseudomonadota bacterium]
IRDPQTVADPVWYGGKPLWRVAEENGLLSAIYFWPGSEAKGLTPTYVKTYDETIPNEMRIKQVSDWLDLPEEKRPHFICLYFSNIDTVGHLQGPESETLKKELGTLDQTIGKLLGEIEKKKLPINIIILSDHGMLLRDENKKVLVDELVDLSDYKKNKMVQSAGAMMMIYVPVAEKSRALRDQLNAKAKYFKAYLKEETPKKLHYRNNERIGNVVLLAVPGASLVLKETVVKAKADHGFPVDESPEMKAIFYAQGPRIIPGSVGEFPNTQIYPLVHKILGLPAPKGNRLSPELDKHIKNN